MNTRLFQREYSMKYFKDFGFTNRVARQSKSKIIYVKKFTNPILSEL